MVISLYCIIVFLYSVVFGIILLYYHLYSAVVALLSPFACGILKSIIHCSRYPCVGLTFCKSPVYQILVVCLFVLPLPGRISLFLYFVTGLLYNICNIQF